RRDNHTCRYCGAAAPDAPLRIDHVTPVALGGTDTADNLVTACEPCNSGKTSTTTDAATVADVKQDALRWAEAMKQAAANLTAADRHKAAYRDAFLAEWNRWGAGKGKQRREIDLPKDWKASIEQFRAAGLPATVWAEVVDTSMGNDTVRVDNKFRYCCGVAWRMVTKLQEDARRIVASAEEPAGSAIADAILTFWQTEWSENRDDDLDPEQMSKFRRSLHAHLRNASAPDHLRLMEAARMAMYFDAPDIKEGLEFLRHEEGMRAVGAWANAWTTACGDFPSRELHARMVDQVTDLMDADINQARVLRAAAIAGSNCSTRLHHGLSQDELDTTGVQGLWEASADTWSRAYHATAGQWPTAEQRDALYESGRRHSTQAPYTFRDFHTAAAAAGAYLDIDLGTCLPFRGSTFKAAQLAAPAK
ncbi:HNH endonuclease, partial [Kitasatospora sp. NPDC057015]|uniref:HNH endonuclease n=1 Tax=Kitasatospora sp. NPDC057015 TaxID=3346001 RepID=UPI00363CA081